VIVERLNTANSSNPAFGHRMPEPARIVVQDGVVQEGMETTFQAANPDGLELTPPSRLSAIFKTEYANSTKPKKRVEAAGEVETIVQIAADVVEVESYVEISALVERDNVLNPDDREYEEALDLPWKELKAA
jgi:hypothetical protein